MDASSRRVGRTGVHPTDHRPGVWHRALFDSPRRTVLSTRRRHRSLEQHAGDGSRDRCPPSSIACAGIWREYPRAGRRGRYGVSVDGVPPSAGRRQGGPGVQTRARPGWISLHSNLHGGRHRRLSVGPLFPERTRDRARSRALKGESDLNARDTRPAPGGIRRGPPALRQELGRVLAQDRPARVVEPESGRGRRV